MGDVVMASPLAEGLRRRYPGASVTWLAEPQVAPLVQHNPAVDAVLVWPKMRWKELFRTRRYWLLSLEIKTFLRRLRGEKFTVVIDAQGLFRTRLLAWISGAGSRIGFLSREPGQFLMTRMVGKGDTATREMGREYFHLLDQLAVETDDLRHSVHLPEESYLAASSALSAAGITGGYAVFAPFTTRPQKHWFDQSWTELAREVSEKLALPVVWLGGPADREHGDRLADGGGGENLAGKTSLTTSAAIIAKAAFMVGVDTGLTHVGTAFGIPTVALFGSTSPYSETRSPHTVILYHQLACSPCRRRPTCKGSFDCMQAITVEEVMQLLPHKQTPLDASMHL